ncbi:hypothetical protein FHW69_001719 [Luteibacter sp. Sphag1AF]|uniref:hypothetical protein n=1 Tax=Luteibacter sp. Sphag1AF TaxID=2587031 RepID=UPI0016124625|nr:hypothetical protein [Luteibacter sp. Sphag1AF]MBB3227118.1 hypothetical protein [Luteibacter sp. Sphag1AF]
MKRWMFALCFVLFFIADAHAQLTYRNNDPFVFCRYGQKNPDKCWQPLPPYTGPYMISAWCEPNPYGKEWTADDYASLEEYKFYCPKAKKSGSWTGPGTGEQSRGMH